MRKAAKDQVGRAGELLVAAEIHRRGGYATAFSGNMPGIDILASNVDHSRLVTIQVKTKSRGTWQTNSLKATPEKRVADALGTRFWVMVGLPPPPAVPAFFIMPEEWILDDIHERGSAYRARWLEEQGSERPSFHHAIAVNRIEEWRDRWDVLGIF